MEECKLLTVHSGVGEMNVSRESNLSLLFSSDEFDPATSSVFIAGYIT